MGGAAERAASLHSWNLLPLCSRWTLISKADRPFPSGNQPIDAAVLLVRPRRTPNTLTSAVIISRQKRGGGWNYHLERIRFPGSSPCTLLLLSFHFLSNGPPPHAASVLLSATGNLILPDSSVPIISFHRVQRPEKQIKTAGRPSGRSEWSGSPARLCYALSHQWKQNTVGDKNRVRAGSIQEAKQQCTAASIIRLMDFFREEFLRSSPTSCCFQIAGTNHMILILFCHLGLKKRGKCSAKSKVMNLKTTQPITAFASELNIQ